MNAPERTFLPDIQSLRDTRNIPINAVGIKDVRYPVSIATATGHMPSVASFSMTVGLPASAKGTHMSRFIELLEAQTEALDQTRFKELLLQMLDRLDADHGTIEMRFPYFIKKTAPISAVQSLLDLDVCWKVSRSCDGRIRSWMQIVVAATSLCPCSKEISAYGAHNQRSHITIEAELAEDMPIEDLVSIAERSASCEVYGLLKRPDEKYVTERAYDNPKFVEDLVRDVAVALDEDKRIAAYMVEVENFESIHNHSAFARIVRPGKSEEAIPAP